MNTIISKALKNPYIYILIIAAAIFLYFRFDGLPERIIFDWDQENYAKQIREAIKGNFTLIGPRTTSDTGFFLAPYFTYLMLPFYALANFHPSGSMYFLWTYNILFIAAATYFLTKMFSFRFSALFIAFWAFNFTMVEYDTIPWWPVILPLGILTTFYLLHQTLKRKELYWWILLGICEGLFINMHFQYIFIIFFTFIFYIIHFWKLKEIPWKNIGVAFVSFAAMFAPLVLFDIRNKFLNTGLFFNFFFGDGTSGAIKTTNGWIPVLTNFLEPFTNMRVDIVTLALYAAIALMFVYLFRSEKKGFHKEFFLASLIIWITVPLFFIAYGQRPSEYYFIFLLPFMLIAIITFFIRLRFSRVLLVLLVMFAIGNYDNIEEKRLPEPFGLAAKEKTAQYIKNNYDTKTFNVSFDVAPGREPGFRYIFEHYGIITHDKGDGSLPLIEIMIPPEEATAKITDDIGLKVNPKIKPIK